MVQFKFDIHKARSFYLLQYRRMTHIEDQNKISILADASNISLRQSQHTPHTHKNKQTPAHQQNKYPPRPSVIPSQKNPTAQSHRPSNIKSDKPHLQFNPNHSQKQNQQLFFSGIFHRKLSKLSTSFTHQQKERYMRKLAQTIEQRRFNAVGFQFDVECVKQICEFVTFSHITQLVLDKNPLGDQGVIKLSGLLQTMDIQELSLMSVGITNKSASYLFVSLTGKPSFKKLNISSLEGTLKNKVTVEGTLLLNLLLKHESCALDTLQMDSVCLGTEGVRTAFETIQTNPLQCLTLCKNQIGPKYCSVFANNISGMPLMRLDLSKNNLMNPGLRSLTEILGLSYSKNSISMNLVYLNISFNGINSYGFEYFCMQMGFNQTLETLIMDENPLGEGSRFFNIKYYLNKNWGLKRLSLVNFSPSDKDLKCLCEGLEANRSLDELVLSKNQVDGQTISCFLVMLGINKSLRQMVMNNCKISDGHIIKNEYLFQLNTYTAIEEIQFENNYINNKGANILKKLAVSNPNILKLNLTKNCVGEKVIVEIAEVLKDNETKRPFQHQLNYFQSVSQLYEQKRRALKTEVESMKGHEDRLKTAQLTDQIHQTEFCHQNITKQIEKEQKIIQTLLSDPHLKSEDKERHLTEERSLTEPPNK